MSVIFGKSNPVVPAAPLGEWPYFVDLIAEIGASVSVELLRECVPHYSGYVREAALRRCAALPLPGLFPLVVNRLNDWVPQVTQAAREAFMALLPVVPAAQVLAELPAVLQLQNAGRADHASWLAQVEERLLAVLSVDELAAAVRGAELRVARACMQVIRQQGALDASAMLAILLVRSDDIVLSGQAMQLGAQLPQDEQVTLYRQGLHSHFGPVRVTALRALLAMPEVEHGRIATAALTDVQGAVRAVAARYLRSAGVDVRAYYRKLLEQGDMLAQRTRICLSALAELRDPDDIPLISAFLGSDAASVRIAAYTAWLKLAEREKDAIAQAAFLDATPGARKFALQAQRKQGAYIPLSLIESTLLERDDVGTTMLFAESQRWNWLVCIAQVALAPGTVPIRGELEQALRKWLGERGSWSQEPGAAQSAFLASPAAIAVLDDLLGEDVNARENLLGELVRYRVLRASMPLPADVPTAQVLTPVAASRIHRTSGLGLAGLFGGPLALSYLLYRDLRVLHRADLGRRALAWFAPLSGLWLYCLLSFPPDLISQWILYLPQPVLWWIVARHLLRPAHACYVQGGGQFFSRWRGFGAGVMTFCILKLTFFVADSVLYP